MGIAIAIGNRIGRGTGTWTPRWVDSKMLYWGKTSEIIGGEMPNKVTGATDHLDVAGSPATYVCPNTSPYIAADHDTDSIWFKTDETPRTTTTAELIGYDFARTLVKYDNVSPYTIREIIILKDGETLTTSEMNFMRDYMDLSIWWNGVLSLYGNLKGNRGAGQSVWTPEAIAVAPTVTTTVISAILDVTATSGGDVTDDGGDTVTARGVCWSTSANPTTANSKTTNGTGEGEFASNLTSLLAATTYHVRAYATNSIGTSYGADVQFNTAVLYDTFTDSADVRLNAHTMNVGAGWTEWTEGWKHYFAINQVYEYMGSSAIHLVTADAGKANVDVSATAKIPTSDIYAGGLSFRVQDATHYWILLLERDAVGSAYMALRREGGVINSVNVTNPSQGDTVTLRVVANGNSIKSYLNGVLANDITDATYNDKTLCGLSSYTDPVDYLFMLHDNFIVL